MVDCASRAREWDGNPAFVERDRPVAEAVRARLPLDRSLHALDCGCGTGRVRFPRGKALGPIPLQDGSPGMARRYPVFPRLARAAPC